MYILEPRGDARVLKGIHESTWIITRVAYACQEYCTYEYIDVFAGGNAGVQYGIHDGVRASTWIITCVAYICQEYCTYEYIAVFAGGDAGVHDGGRGEAHRGLNREWLVPWSSIKVFIGVYPPTALSSILILISDWHKKKPP